MLTRTMQKNRSGCAAEPYKRSRCELHRLPNRLQIPGDRLEVPANDYLEELAEVDLEVLKGRHAVMLPANVIVLPLDLDELVPVRRPSGSARPLRGPLIVGKKF